MHGLVQKILETCERVANKFLHPGANYTYMYNLHTVCKISACERGFKPRLHYQSFLAQENLVKVFDADFDSVNGKGKLWSKTIKEFGRTSME